MTCQFVEESCEECCEKQLHKCPDMIEEIQSISKVKQSTADMWVQNFCRARYYMWITEQESKKYDEKNRQWLDIIVWAY